MGLFQCFYRWGKHSRWQHPAHLASTATDLAERPTASPSALLDTSRPHCCTLCRSDASDGDCVSGAQDAR